MKKSLLAIAATLACLGLSAHADTLKKIKDSASVTMGVRESSGSLSYTLGDGKYVGYHVEICQRVLADVQKQLGLAKLEVKYGLPILIASVVAGVVLAAFRFVPMLFRGSPS